jgi:DNA-binding NarL/FixJ family response regulator
MEAKNLRGQPESSAPKRRVFIVDDHPILRQGITQLINQEKDLMVCGGKRDGAGSFGARQSQTDIMVVIFP